MNFQQLYWLIRSNIVPVPGLSNGHKNAVDSIFRMFLIISLITRSRELAYSSILENRERNSLTSFY